MPDSTEWSSMRIDGGGYMTGVVSVGGETYARSDISGFYKRNEDGSWTEMLDFLKPSERNLMGAAGIAISPSDPKVVYAALGQFDEREGKVMPGAVIKTTNGGKTWVTVNENLRFGSLMAGRVNGEPIAVSPTDSNTVIVLSKREGLYKTADGGKTWTELSGFAPESEDVTGFVEFSKTNASIIYVNVYGEGMYISENGGESFYLSDGSPKYLRRCSERESGELLCSALDGIYEYSEGAWNKRYTPSDGAGIGGISVDPFDDTHVIAVTSSGVNDAGLGNNHILESTDGGKTFTDRLHDHGKNFNGIFVNPSIFDNVLTASSSIVFDGERRGTAYISDWYGVFETEDITASPMTLIRNSKGIEDTVCYTVKAIPSELSSMAGFCDINAVGWRGTDSMAEYMGDSSNIQDTTDIDYCGSDTNILARAGVRHASNSIKDISIEYSADGGKTWTVANAPTSGVTQTAHIALSTAKGESGNPAMIVSGKDGVYYSTDCGSTYTKSEGVPNISHALYIYDSPMAADRVLGKTFYICSSSGFYVSGNGGASFKKYNASGLPVASGAVQVEASPYTAGTVLVTIEGRGVYITYDYGNTFTQIGDFENPLGAAFGKGKEENTAAIYVYDGSDEKCGIYESDNMGDTWKKLRINGNNFCAMSDIDADKNEYGIIYIGTGVRGVFCIKLKDK